MSLFDECVQRTIKWGEGIDLYNQSTREKQILYAYKEFQELIVAVEENDLAEIKDAIGDILVCLTNADHICGSETWEPVSYSDDKTIEDIDSLLVVLGSEIPDTSFCCMDYLARISAHYNLELEDCFLAAVETIEKRELLMVNGIAVKWENMTDEQKEQWRELNG